MAKYYFKCNVLKKGMVICFDYKLNECNNRGDDLVLTYKNREMVVPHDELKARALKLDNTLYPSKYGTAPFKNYHFVWKPTDGEEISNKQPKMI